MPDRLKVVFIAGAGRSGTTLLGQMLGQIDGWFCAGELFFLWDRILERSVCGCSRPIDACEIWKEVCDEFSGSSAADLQALIDMRDSLKVRPQGLAGGEVRLRNLWHRLRGKVVFHRPEDAKRLIDGLGRALRRLASTTGAKVIVDSSKSSAHGYLLSQIDDIDFYEVHVVRDPRAVTYAWKKKKKLYDVLDDKPRYFPQRKTVECVADWMWSNYSAEHLLPKALRQRHYLRVRYEDLIASPHATIERVVRALGDQSDIDFIAADGSVDLRANHMVAGNPSRFSQGSTRLRLDEEWREKLARHHRLGVGLGSLPLMLKYGYRLGRNG